MPKTCTHEMCRDAEDCVLDERIETARKHVMTPEERRAQTISFAYGNLVLDNPAITREMVERAYDELAAAKS